MRYFNTIYLFDNKYNANKVSVIINYNIRSNN